MPFVESVHQVKLKSHLDVQYYDHGIIFDQNKKTINLINFFKDARMMNRP